MCANFGCLRSWRYCDDCPNFLSRAGIARLWRNLAGYRCWADWDGVITLAMAAVRECVYAEIGDVSIFLFTLGGGRSALGNLDLVRRLIGSSLIVMDGCGVGIGVA